MKALVALLVLTAPVYADTVGYQRVTPFAQDIAIDQPKGAPRVIVARTPDEWAAAWRDAGGTGTRASVDFERDMVVGVVNGPNQDRVIYRIQLDNGAHPTELEVHLGFGDAPTWAGNTRKATPAQFVVTPRSALPVHFLHDEMVDAGMLGFTSGEGVDSSDVARVAGVARPNLKAALREDAEQRVIAQLTPAERKHLLTNDLGTWKRIPNGWTKLAITRDATRWTITYDDLTFEVEIATGTVKRRARP